MVGKVLEYRSTVYKLNASKKHDRVQIHVNTSIIGIPVARSEKICIVSLSWIAGSK